MVIKFFLEKISVRVTFIIQIKNRYTNFTSKFKKAASFFVQVYFSGQNLNALAFTDLVTKSLIT